MKFERFLDLFKGKKHSEEILIPQHDSLSDEGPVVYKGNTIVFDPSKIPAGGEGYPIRYFGKSARVVGNGKGGFDIYLEK